jgi:hypothetical protein
MGKRGMDVLKFIERELSKNDWLIYCFRVLLHTSYCSYPDRWRRQLLHALLGLWTTDSLKNDSRCVFPMLHTSFDSFCFTRNLLSLGDHFKSFRKPIWKVTSVLMRNAGWNIGSSGRFDGESIWTWSMEVTTRVIIHSDKVILELWLSLSQTKCFLFFLKETVLSD